MPHDLRDQVCDFVRHYATLTGVVCARLLAWIGLSPRKFHNWRERYGRANEHNALIPRDHCITPRERQAIIDFAGEYPLEGYRRLTFMMLDRDLVAVSPSTTYRVLKDAGLLQPWNLKPTKKGTGFVRNRLCSTHPAPRALACRFLLHQHRRHFLLPLLSP